MMTNIASFADLEVTSLLSYRCGIDTNVLTDGISINRVDKKCIYYFEDQLLIFVVLALFVFELLSSRERGQTGEFFTDEFCPKI